MANRVLDRQAKRKKTSGTKNSKRTRRVNLGWKLCFLPSCAFVQQSLSAGGGVQHTDMLKTWSLKEAVEFATNLFFPGGVAPIQTLNISSAIEVYLATFQGCRITSDDFPVEKYFNEHSNPVRLYLHTLFVSDNATNSDTNC